MTNTALHPLLARRLGVRPAVHQLCQGVFLQEHILLPGLAIVPMQAIGFGQEAHYLARYTVECTNSQVEQSGLQRLIEEGREAKPALAIIVTGIQGDSPEVLESQAAAQLDEARRTLAWSTGNHVEPFGLVVVAENQTYFRITPPHSNRRVRLGFGNLGADFNAGFCRILELQQKNEHFAFALAMLNDANSEQNKLFKIARLFACLEALAYRIKSKERPARRAIRYMLGLHNGANTSINTGLESYRYDEIELAGLVRDKVFHGANLDERDYPGVPKNTFHLLRTQPDQIASNIQTHCELEIARWANDASVARAVAEGRALVLPYNHPATK